VLRQNLGLGAFATGFRDGEEGGEDGHQQGNFLVRTFDRTVPARHEILPVCLIYVLLTIVIARQASGE
jgi:hypothetical protein